MAEVDSKEQPAVSAMDLLQKRKSRTADIEDNRGPTEEHMTYDLGRLAAFYSSPSEKFELTNHQQMLEKAANTVQFLVGRFFALPSEPVEGGRLVELPAAVTQLPREKPIPKPRPLTRWEKFAKEKGIQKKKKDLMVYDDKSKEWKPRFGYKRKENDSDALPPIIEAGPGDDGSENPWDKKDRERKERSSKQKSR